MGRGIGVRLRRAAAAAAVLCLCAAGLHVHGEPAPPTVSSVSAVVFEPQSGRFLYEKDAHTARPMASTTKLMTALVAARQLDPADTVRVPAGAVPVEGTQIGLTAGDEITVRDLLAALLLSSGNDAANALALLTDGSFSAFSARMDACAKELGMTDSHFITPSGLDAEGHAASAADMARLGAAVLRVPVLAELCRSKTAQITLSGRRMTIKNHNKLLWMTDGCLGLKTGFTKKAGRCLVSAAERGGVTLVAVTLRGGDDWHDHLALYDYGFSMVHAQALPDAAPPSAAVAGGTADSVPLAHAAPPQAVLKNGETVQAEVCLLPVIWAPVEPGDVLGKVVYRSGERVICTLPLTAGERVDARPVPGRIALWLRRVGQLLWALLG